MKPLLKEASELFFKILRAEFVLIPVHKYLDNVYYTSYSDILRKLTKYSFIQSRTICLAYIWQPGVGGQFLSNPASEGKELFL